MGKKIIITAGPTNEPIDAVMQITNMATGALGVKVTEALLDRPEYFKDIDRVFFLSPQLAYKPENRWGDKLKLVSITDTQSLLDTMVGLLTKNTIDAVVHSCAVGDYRAKYSIRGEDLAREIAQRTAGLADQDSIYSTVMEILDMPQGVQNDNTKMSSYEPHLMTMLTLTPKVIGSIKSTSPDTMLIGFKLLEGVSKEELYQVAMQMLKRNNASYIVANDLARIGNGRHWAMILDGAGNIAECQDKAEIAQVIAGLIFGKAVTDWPGAGA